MPKLTLIDALGGYQTVNQFNANNSLTEAALENTLSRDGTTPNEMEVDLDMNSNSIINCVEIKTTNLTLNGVPVSVVGTGATNLSGLTDVNSSTPTDRFALVADGVDWESRLLVEADISDLQAYITDAPSDGSQYARKDTTWEVIDLTTKVNQTNPILDGTVTGTAFLDEDTLGSDSDTALASQQSIKAYVDSAVASTGVIRQVVNVTNSEVNTGTQQFNLLNAIPQNTEGNEYMTLAITPTASANKLKIEVVVQASHSASISWMAAGLFQDATADALAAGWGGREAGIGAPTLISFIHYMTAGTTLPTTFKVRVGSGTVGTTTFNGVVSGRIFGGVASSSITITEIKV